MRWCWNCCTRPTKKEWQEQNYRHHITNHKLYIQNTNVDDRSMSAENVYWDAVIPQTYLVGAEIMIYSVKTLTKETVCSYFPSRRIVSWRTASSCFKAVKKVNTEQPLIVHTAFLNAEKWLALMLNEQYILFATCLHYYKSKSFRVPTDSEDILSPETVSYVHILEMLDFINEIE